MQPRSGDRKEESSFYNEASIGARSSSFSVIENARSQVTSHVCRLEALQVSPGLREAKVDDGLTPRYSMKWGESSC
jgi:hypothetical protein